MGRFAGVLFVAPAFAFEVRPDPNLTPGSVRLNGHTTKEVCNAMGMRGPMPDARRDEVLRRYELPPGGSRLRDRPPGAAMPWGRCQSRSKWEEVTNLLEQAINADDGDDAAKIIQRALGIESDDVVNYVSPKAWRADRDQRARIIRRVASNRGKVCGQDTRMKPSPQDFHLLKALKAAGERGRAIQASHIRVVLDRLARGGFVVGRPMGGELVNYRITQRGQDTLVEHDLK